MPRSMIDEGEIKSLFYADFMGFSEQLRSRKLLFIKEYEKLVHLMNDGGAFSMHFLR
jgi:hypothetical protein